MLPCLLSCLLLRWCWFLIDDGVRGLWCRLGLDGDLVLRCLLVAVVDLLVDLDRLGVLDLMAVRVCR